MKTKTIIFGTLEANQKLNSDVIDNDITVVKVAKDETFYKHNFDV